MTDTSTEETITDNMVKQTTELWEISTVLSKKIETSNHLVYENDEINEFGKKYEGTFATYLPFLFI